MTDLLNEFDEKRYPFRYRMNVGDRGGTRLRLYLSKAAENLGLDMGLAVRHNGQHDPNHDRRNTFDIGVGLTNEADYALLIGELDRLSLERYDASLTAQTEWDARVAEFKATHPDWEQQGLNPSLEIDYADMLARTDRQADRTRDLDDGLEL